MTASKLLRFCLRPHNTLQSEFMTSLGSLKAATACHRKTMTVSTENVTNQNRPQFVIIY